MRIGRRVAEATLNGGVEMVTGGETHENSQTCQHCKEERVNGGRKSGKAFVGSSRVDGRPCVPRERSHVARPVGAVCKTERCVLGSHSNNRWVEEVVVRYNKAVDASVVTTKP